VLKIIRNHNYLNGNLFSFIEFVVVTLVILPFAAYYIVLMKKEKSIGIVKLYSDNALREKIRAEYPNLASETIVLCVAILVPFSIPIACTYRSAMR
jgi:hypothetical protein